MFDAYFYCAMYPETFRGGNAPDFLKVCPMPSHAYFLGMTHKSSLSILTLVQGAS